MKYAIWKYRFMHNRLTEMGFKPTGLEFKKANNPVYVGLYHKGDSIIHIEDMIADYEGYVEANK